MKDKSSGGMRTPARDNTFLNVTLSFSPLPFVVLLLFFSLAYIYTHTHIYIYICGGGHNTGGSKGPRENQHKGVSASDWNRMTCSFLHSLSSSLLLLSSL